MKIMVMSRHGHDVRAEWDADTSADTIDAINADLSRLLTEGYAAFLVESGLKITEISTDTTEDVLLVAPVCGG